VSKLFAPALYEALSERYRSPHVAPEVMSSAPTGESWSGRRPDRFWPTGLVSAVFRSVARLHAVIRALQENV